jgi:putative signal transducing protein
MSGRQPGFACVFETGSVAVAAVARSLLEGERIRFYTKNELSQGALAGYTFAIGPIEFWVRSEDAASVRLLLKELRPN